MTTQDLAGLGITTDDILNKLVDKLLLNYINVDRDYKSKFARKVEASVIARVDEHLDRAFKEFIEPQVDTMIDNICLQQTNAWGEKKGEPMSFVEYFTSRMETYMAEGVSYDGKTKSQENYHWKQESTRLVHLIDKHLQSHIDNAIQTGLKEFTDFAKDAIVISVKDSLKRMSLSVQTKVVTL